MIRHRTAARIAFALVMSLLAVACGSRQLPGSVEPGGEQSAIQAYRASEVDREPKLIKCAEYRGPSQNSISGGRWEFVTLGFVVTEAGQVDNRSIFVKSAARRPSQPDASQKSIAEAQQIALTCEYEPGLLNGQAVRVATERRFRILAAI